MARKPATPAQKEASRKAREEKVSQMQDQLANQVEDLAGSEGWAKWLAFMGSFHHYSVNNQLLILTQCPEATQVAGFRSWQDKGRQVRKGSKAIRIFGLPFRMVKDKDKETGEEIRKRIPTPPMVLSVFDISQTDPIEGVEQAELPVSRLQGEDIFGIYAGIESVVASRGWTVDRETVAGEANGFCTLDGSRRIVVEADLDPAMAAKTLAHELAHSILHANEEGFADKESPQDAGVRELEAESVAHVVAGYLGLDTSEYSNGYLAAWSGGDADKVRAVATRVQGAVHEVLDALENVKEAVPA